MDQQPAEAGSGSDADSPVETQDSQGRRREVRSRRLLAGVIWGLLILAAALPLLGYLTGVEWLSRAWVLTPLAAAIVAGATALARRRVPAGHVQDSRLLEAAAVIFPPVRRYVDDLAQDRATFAENAKLVDNMNAVLRAYRLGGLGPEVVDSLARNTERGRRVGELDLNGLADEVGRLVGSGLDPGLPRELRDHPGMLAACLHILAEERGTGAVMGLGVPRVGKPNEARPVAVPPALLASLVSRHELVAQTRESLAAGDTTTTVEDVSDVSQALKNIGGFSLPEVMHQLRQAQHTIAKNVAGVIEDYNLGVLDETSLAGLDQHLAGRPFADLPHEAAAYAANRLIGGPQLSPDQTAMQLELLYRDRFNRPTNTCWSNNKKDLVTLLPPVLLASRHLDPGDLPLDAPRLVIVLKRLDTFTLAFLQQIVLSLDQLWQLTADFARFCENEDLPAPLPDDPILHDAFYTLITDELPAKPTGLARLGDPAVAVTLLRQLAASWVNDLEVPEDRNDDAEATRPQTPDDLTGKSALAEVAVGAFLTRTGLRPELGVRHAKESAHHETLRKMLVARMWQRRTAVHAGLTTQASLARLGRQWLSWLGEARTELGAQLDGVLENVRQELLGGAWPVLMRDDPDTPRLAVQIEQVADAIQALSEDGQSTKEREQELGDLLRQVAHSTSLSSETVDERVDAILTAAVRGASQDLTAALQQSRRDLLSGIQVYPADPSTRSLAQVADEIHLLQQTEQQLAREVHHLVTDSDIPGDRFLVTFGRGHGPLADHVDKALESVGCPQTHYTPYARLGYLPHGMTPVDFCTRLEDALKARLAEGTSHTQASSGSGTEAVAAAGPLCRLLPHDPSTTPAGTSDITVQFIGRPTRWQISANGETPTRSGESAVRHP